MLDILFLDIKTGDVRYAVDNVSLIRYITPSEIGFNVDGRQLSLSFLHTEKVEVSHKTNSPMREALLRTVPHA